MMLLAIHYLDTATIFPRRGNAANSSSRFHWPSNISCSIATIILEDHYFVETFVKQSHQLLRLHRDFAAQVLMEAKIPYAPGG